MAFSLFPKPAKGKPPEVGFAEIEKMAGKQFDPNCAVAFVAIREQVIESMHAENETAVVAATARPRTA